MERDPDKDEEREWFEPVEQLETPEFINNLGPLTAFLRPERRVFLLIGLTLLTFVGGLNVGAFELRPDDAKTQSTLGATPSAPPVNAQQALRKHMQALKVPLKAETTADAPPAEPTTQPGKEKAELDDKAVGKPVEDKPVDSNKEAETINLAEALELGNEALGSKDWGEASQHLERASQAWTKKRAGKAWRKMRYDLSKAHYKNKKPMRAVEILEQLRETDPKWDKPLLLLGLAAKNAEKHAKAVRYLSTYLEKGGSKTAKVCPYLDEQNAVDQGSQDVQEACSLDE